MNRLVAGAMGLCAAFFAAAPGAFAQVIAVENLGAPAPVHQSIDSNGVDVASGRFHSGLPGVSIGAPGSGGLAYTLHLADPGGVRSSFDGTITVSGAVYTVAIGYRSETFTLAAGVYTSDQATGSTLTYASSLYTYTTRDGTVAVFDPVLAQGRSQTAYIKSVTSPAGEVDTFTYNGAVKCTPSCGGTTVYRLQSVTNNFGYQIKLYYAVNGSSVSTADWPNWFVVTSAVAFNMATDYCAPTAVSCTYTKAWPSVAYDADPYTPTTAATDALNRTTTFGASGSTYTITSPSGAIIAVTLDGSSRTYTLTNGVGIWTYGYVDSGGTRTTTVADPLGNTRVVTSSLSTSLVSADQNGVGKTTGYQYDAYGRPTQVTLPEGGYSQLAYDGRGNVTSTTMVAKSGSGLSNIVASAGYDSTCVYPAKCNKPNSTTDARGNQTDYTYNTTTGLPLTVTAPAPTTGAVRPQTRYSYTALYAYYKNSGGTIVAAPSAVTLLTGTSACRTTSSCSGGSDEVKTTIVYGSTGVANNLLPTSVSAGSGDGALTATSASTYDVFGNLSTVDGPLSGSGDTTQYRYNAGRQLIGVVGPDPDGAGALHNRAVRYSYNIDGQVSLIEQGTVNSYSDADWAAFSSLQQAAGDYDALGRKIKDSVISGGVTYAVTQYAYDNANRLQCAAVRMNSAVFASLPGACVLSAPGGSGPDRITLNSYDAGGRVIKVTTGYLSASQRDVKAVTYSDDGLAASLTDGAGNISTQEYDGFDRLSKLRYPNPSGGGSSTTDFVRYTYDAASNMTQRRLRDGQGINFAYDALNRAMSKGAPGSSDDELYAYDNLGHLTYETTASQTLTYGYDALGRLVSQVHPLGTVSTQYDLAGRRTRLTWPDAFYVTYDWDTANELTAERESGAGSGSGVLAVFSYDNLGRRTAIARAGGSGASTAYGYDAVSRLTSLSQDLAGTSDDQAYAFAYNPAGQLVGRAAANAAYAWAGTAQDQPNVLNGLNQYVSVNAVAYGYDARGNLTSGPKTFTYDAQDRLLTVSGSPSTTLSYDPPGRLYQTAAATTTRFLYDGSDLIAEYDTSGNVLRRYVHGPGTDEPLVWYEGADSSSRRWLLADERGSIFAAATSSAARQFTNTYDEYGVGAASNTGRFQYTGQAWIAEAGVYNYKARDYLPGIGTFLQTDPAGYGAGMNLYGYAGGNPIGRSDPSGMIYKYIEEPGVPDASSFISAGDIDSAEIAGTPVSSYTKGAPIGVIHFTAPSKTSASPTNETSSPSTLTGGSLQKIDMWISEVKSPAIIPSYGGVLMYSQTGVFEISIDNGDSPKMDSFNTGSTDFFTGESIELSTIVIPEVHVSVTNTSVSSPPFLGSQKLGFFFLR